MARRYRSLADEHRPWTPPAGPRPGLRPEVPLTPARCALLAPGTRGLGFAGTVARTELPAGPRRGSGPSGMDPRPFLRTWGLQGGPQGSLVRDTHTRESPEVLPTPAASSLWLKHGLCP